MFGLRLGKLGAAIKAGTGSVGVVPLFSRDYEAAGSLGANATFARSSSATIVDHEGVIRTVPSGAARFNGLRYVRNLVVHSEDGTSWTKYRNPGLSIDTEDYPQGTTQSVVIETDTQYEGIQLNGVEQGKVYAVSAFIKGTTGSELVWLNDDSTSKGFFSITDEWKRYTQIFTLTNGASIVFGVLTTLFPYTTLFRSDRKSVV